MKKTLTITTEDLDKAIEARNKGQLLSYCCVVTVAARRTFRSQKRRVNSAGGRIYLYRSDGDWRTLIPQTYLERRLLRDLMDTFDEGGYDDVRSLLPFTVEVARFD